MNTTLNPDVIAAATQEERLEFLRDVLEEIEADERLIRAVDQALADNEAYDTDEHSDDSSGEPLPEAGGPDQIKLPGKLDQAAARRVTLRRLKRLVQQANAPSRELDRHLHLAFGFEGRGEVPLYTVSNDAIDVLISKMLPGFWETSGLCQLTGHASIGPDYKPPHTEWQRAAWPEEQSPEGFNSDLGPAGGGDHRKCLTRLDCILQALIARKDISSS